jgi:GPI mannosyltransferase 1 subunit M
LWLQQGFQLEFLGESTFVPGLWLSSLLFYAVNMWLLGVIIDDVGGKRKDSERVVGRAEKRSTDLKT